ncbi:MAG: hypothetical protein HPY76_02375 [Anaerolineae bacterium]|jgi:Na+-translocating ferredoxin:NAD+ oxidoreductase RnfE subunit|nr:hypothetical protein [Anaerolineae bacterium]
MEQSDNWKTKTLIIGAIVGALGGLLAGYILIQRSEATASKPALSAGDGVKVGLGVLDVLRVISDIGIKN